MDDNYGNVFMSDAEFDTEEQLLQNTVLRNLIAGGGYPQKPIFRMRTQYEKEELANQYSIDENDF